MSKYKWSQTANNNASIDSTINWAEGQSPGSVNNSARAMMAASAKERDDTSGKLETAGTSDDYTLTTYQAFASLIDGMTVTFTASFTNTGAATLNVDTLGAKALVMWPGEDLLAGKLVEGGIYAATYNAAEEEFRLHQPFPETVREIPSGSRLVFVQASAPVGWTQVTTHNDKALRIVDDTGAGTGGSAAFSTVFAERTPTGEVGGTALTVGQLPQHRHLQFANVVRGSHDPLASNETVARSLADGSSSSNYNMASGTGTSATLGQSSIVGSDETHAHSFTGDAMDFEVAYVDAIICEKD